MYLVLGVRAVSMVSSNFAVWLALGGQSDELHEEKGSIDLEEKKFAL